MAQSGFFIYAETGLPEHFPTDCKQDTFELSQNASTSSLNWAELDQEKDQEKELENPGRRIKVNIAVDLQPWT